MKARQFRLFQGTIVILLVLAPAWGNRYHLKLVESSRLGHLPANQPPPRPASPAPPEVGKIPRMVNYGLVQTKRGREKVVKAEENEL